MNTALKLCGCHEAHKANLRLRINKVLQFDPTRTVSVRRAFSGDLSKRFRKLKGDINKTIVTNDAFGIKPPKKPKLIKIQQPALPRAFDFPTDAAKVEEFMEWLEGNIDLDILEVTAREGRRVTARKPWQNVYIDSSYKKGIARAHTEMTKQGIPVPPEDRFIDAVFNRPIHADRVGLIYTRTFNELKGITQTMSQQISRVLAQGLAEGRGPRQIARQINDRVDKIGRTRALTLARTEVIRAHHVATINTYREARVEGVTVKAEWSTAGDARVCPDCAFMQGRVFTLEEIEPLIPLHPNCRCVAIPAEVGEEAVPEPTGKERAQGVGSDFLNKKGQFKRAGFFEGITGKKLPGAPPPGKKIKKPAGVPKLKLPPATKTETAASIKGRMDKMQKRIDELNKETARIRKELIREDKKRIAARKREGKKEAKKKLKGK